MSETGWLLGLSKIWITVPLPTILHQAETRLIDSQPFPVSVSGLVLSLSAAPVPCWYRKCQYQAMVIQTVREYPHQLASQTQGLHDTQLEFLRLFCFACSFFSLFCCGGQVGWQIGQGEKSSKGGEVKKYKFPFEHKFLPHWLSYVDGERIELTEPAKVSVA